VLGDGLSDSGRFGVLTDGAYPPSPPFHDGRWTNGPTWIETLASRLGWNLDPADSLAQGGATTGSIASDPAAYGITHIGEAYLLDDQIDFANPLRARHEIPAHRTGVDPDAFMSFWSLAAGRRVHDALAAAAANLLSAYFDAGER
jgi:hypothetical protein